MKKIYLLLIAFLAVVFFNGSLKAQITYSTLPDDGFTHLISDVSTWVGGIKPPNPCTLCTIRINDQAILSKASGVLSFINSQIVILGGQSLEVDDAITLTNSSVTVGNDPTSVTKVLLNDQATLSNGSFIQIANSVSFIDARNVSANPITGTISDYASGTILAGIFTFSSDAAAQPDGYYITLTKFAMGNPGLTMPYSFSMYTINCGTSPVCRKGVVYGPAKTVEKATNNYFGFEVSGVLPVVFAQFAATKNEDQSVAVNWSTTQEVNSSYFDIERGSDQATWSKIGTVSAKGFSSIISNYSYTDKSPLAGTAYYRLKEVDLDGKFIYSNVAVVSGDNNAQPLVVYSNPFVDQVRVKVNVDKADDLVLTITDLVGKSYLHQHYNAKSGDNFINLLPNAPSTGLYILHIQGNTYDKTVKLLKQ